MDDESADQGQAPAAAAPGISGIELLIDAIEQLSLARDLSQVTSIVRRAARQLAQADGATFVLRDQDQSYYVDEEAIAPLWKGRRFPLESCVSGWSMQERQAAVIPDIYQDPRVPVDAYRPTFVRSMLMVPIRKAQPVGAIGIYWKERHQASAEQLRLVQALADSTSVAMENIRVYGELEARVRERTDLLEANNRELSAFADSVSHDLKAPLRRILAFSSALSDEYGEVLDGSARAYLSYIATGASNMTEMVDALLALSRFSQTRLSCRACDLSGLAAQIAAELRGDEPGRQVELEIEPAMTAHADPELVRIVLENLLSNAWKFTQGKGDARIVFGRLAEPARDGEPATFYLRDNGAGFRMEYAHELFLPFRRLHSAGEFPGMGIGLATVQRIVNRHGGRVWADGTEGQGACFYWTLAPGSHATRSE